MLETEADKTPAELLSAVMIALEAVEVAALDVVVVLLLGVVAVEVVFVLLGAKLESIAFADGEVVKSNVEETKLPRELDVVDVKTKVEVRMKLLEELTTGIGQLLELTTSDPSAQTKHPAAGLGFESPRHTGQLLPPALDSVTPSKQRTQLVLFKVA